MSTLGVVKEIWRLSLKSMHSDGVARCKVTSQDVAGAVLAGDPLELLD